jgi:hypothetical protein
MMFALEIVARKLRAASSLARSGERGVMARRPFGRMLWSFAHKLFVTDLPCMGVFEHLALIGDGLRSPALDESRPQRNHSQPGADRYHRS